MSYPQKFKINKNKDTPERSSNNHLLTPAGCNQSTPLAMPRAHESQHSSYAWDHSSARAQLTQRLAPPNPPLASPPPDANRRPPPECRADRRLTSPTRPRGGAARRRCSSALGGWTPRGGARSHGERRAHEPRARAGGRRDPGHLPRPPVSQISPPQGASLPVNSVTPGCFKLPSARTKWSELRRACSPLCGGGGGFWQQLQPAALQLPLVC